MPVSGARKPLALFQQRMRRTQEALRSLDRLVGVFRRDHGSAAVVGVLTRAFELRQRAAVARIEPASANEVKTD
jgi:hypothetical protein